MYISISMHAGVDLPRVCRLRGSLAVKQFQKDVGYYEPGNIDDHVYRLLGPRWVDHHAATHARLICFEAAGNMTLSILNIAGIVHLLTKTDSTMPIPLG